MFNYESAIAEGWFGVIRFTTRQSTILIAAGHTDHHFRTYAITVQQQLLRTPEHSMRLLLQVPEYLLWMGTTQRIARRLISELKCIVR